MNEHKQNLLRNLAALRLAVNNLPEGEQKSALRAASEHVIQSASDATHIEVRTGIEMPAIVEGVGLDGLRHGGRLPMEG